MNEKAPVRQFPVDPCQLWVTGDVLAVVHLGLRALHLLFYESVIGLRSKLSLAAFLIFAIWNAVNDPLTGSLMEKLKMPW
jgi:Na+/melibiose symporter-like transporter